MSCLVRMTMWTLSQEKDNTMLYSFFPFGKGKMVGLKTASPFISSASELMKYCKKNICLQVRMHISNSNLKQLIASETAIN